MTEVKVKIMPNSKDSEMMVLGCMLTSINALNVVADMLDDTDFYYKEHKIIFKVLKDAYKNDKPADLHLVCEELKRQDKLTAVGGAVYLTNLAQFAGTSAHIEEYAKEVKKFSIRRSLISAAEVVTNKAADVSQNVESVVSESKNIFNEISDNNNSLSQFECFLENNSEKKLIDELSNISPGVNTGFKIGEVDLTIPGGALSVVAMPTGQGKSTFLINASLGVLNHHHDKSVYFFSYEESEASILTYFFNSWQGKELSKNNRKSIQHYFRTNSLEFIAGENRDQFIIDKKAFFENIIDRGRLRVYYTDMSIQEFVEVIRFIKKNTNVCLICIDYFQLLKLSNPFHLSRQEQLKEISLLLKDVAVETGLPILLGAQFNREVQCEGDLSPICIREAADIEQISSLIIGGWNRLYAGFSREGNISKDLTKIPKESKIYIEILKGRGIGNGHNSVMDFNGNVGKITNTLSHNNIPDCNLPKKRIN